MSVDNSVDIMYGIELDITSSEYFNDIDPEWDTQKFRVEIGQFGDQMGAGGKWIAFYQPSMVSFDKWSYDYGVWPLEDITKDLQKQEQAADILCAATVNLKTVGKPQWFITYSVS